VKIQVIIIFFLLGLVGCNPFEEPYVVGIGQIEIEEANVRKLRLKADLQIHNPNAVAIDLSRAAISIYSDEILLGTVDQDYDVEMSANADFGLPVLIAVDFSKVFEGDVLKALSFANQVISAREVDLRLEGHIYAGKDQAKFKIPIDRSEVVAF